MARNQGAKSADGANGPRDDESKAHTASGITGQESGNSSLYATFEDDDDMAGSFLGDLKSNPQEPRGAGVSVSPYTDDRRHKDPLEGAGYPDMPNDDGIDFSDHAKRLPHIEPRPGFVNAWITWFNADGSVDLSLQRMLKRGWSPVDPSNLKSIDVTFLQRRPGLDGSSEVCTVAGMVLCEMPIERHRRLMEHEKNMHLRMEQGTFNEVREANKLGMRTHSRMQIGIDHSDD